LECKAQAAFKIANSTTIEDWSQEHHY